MPSDGFRSETVVNRRVNKHLNTLLPDRVSTQKAYHLEGQRELPPATLPGNARTCLCLLEIYVGGDGRFEIFEERQFNRDSDAGWVCTNRIRRGPSVRSPFTYVTRTTVELGGETQSERSRAEWAELDTDPIHGGREAQAAALLAEKMGHLRAREAGNGMDHCGSLSHLGSFSNVVDNSRKLRTDWNDIDDLLGPDAGTIAATTGFDELEADEKYRDARQKGIDFLAEDVDEEAADFEGFACDAGAADGEATKPSWRTSPATMSDAEVQAKLDEMRQLLGEMRTTLDGESPERSER